MRVLITGAAGFIGSHLCDRLTADGHDIVGVDNYTTGSEDNWDATVKCDITDRDWFYGIANEHKPELVIHCAASYSDPNLWHRDVDTNIAGAVNVAAVAKHHGARVVYFQTALIYGTDPYKLPDDLEPIQPFALPRGTRFNPQSSYAISKLAAEQYLKLSGVPLLTFRLANIYGPRNLSGPIPTFYKRLAAGEDCTVMDSRRDFVYIDDLVNLVVQAVGAEAVGTYHVSTGTDTEIKTVLLTVADMMDLLPVNFEVTPRGADDAPTILLDPSATFRDFSWAATTEFDEGIAAAVAWYRDNGVTQTFTHLKEPVT